MNNLTLLTFFGIAVIGVIVGLKIALTIMSANRPYVPASSTEIEYTVAKNNDVVYPFLVIVALGMFTYWVVFNYANRKEALTPAPLEQLEATKPEESVAQSKAITIAYQPNKRVNVAPIKQQEAKVEEVVKTVKYGIQILAVTDWNRAKQVAAILATTYSYSVQIFLEEGTYKVVVMGEFNSKAEGLTFQSEQEALTDGFVRTIE